MRNSPSLPPDLLGSSNGKLPQCCLESSSWSLLWGEHWIPSACPFSGALLLFCRQDKMFTHMDDSASPKPLWFTAESPQTQKLCFNRTFSLIFYSLQRQAGNCHWSVNHAGIFLLPFPIWMWLPWKIPRWTGASPMQSWLRGHWHLAGGGLCLFHGWAPEPQGVAQRLPRTLQAMFWKLLLLLTKGVVTPHVPVAPCYAPCPSWVSFTPGVLGIEGVGVDTVSQACLLIYTAPVIAKTAANTQNLGSRESIGVQQYHNSRWLPGCLHKWPDPVLATVVLGPSYLAHESLQCPADGHFIILILPKRLSERPGDSVRAI